MLATLGINEGELVEAKPKKFGQLWKVMFQRNFLCQPKLGPLVQLGFVCRIYPRPSGINLSLISSSISSSHWTLQTDTRTHTYISSVKAQKQRKPPLHTKCLRAPETLLKNTYLISKPKWFCGSEWWNLILTHSITFLCFGCLFLCDLCFSQLDSQINGTILLSAC